MKTAQTMFTPFAQALRPVLCFAAFALAGCQPAAPTLENPAVLAAPYQSVAPLPLWAVAPLNNESGTTTVDALATTDTLIAKVSEVQGLATIPLNRALAAMRSLKMSAVRSPADARRLAEALGADGIIVGTISAYDPYNPPKLGLTLGLFLSPNSRLSTSAAATLDPVALRTSPTDPNQSPAKLQTNPESIVSTYFDGNNHAVLMDLQQYAIGRHDRTGPLGWRKYLVSMDLYAEFVAFKTVERLLQAEQARLAGSIAGVTPSAPLP